MVKSAVLHLRLFHAQPFTGQLFEGEGLRILGGARRVWEVVRKGKCPALDLGQNLQPQPGCVLDICWRRRQVQALAPETLGAQVDLQV